MKSHRLVQLALSSLTLAVASCASIGADKAGGPAAAVTMKMATVHGEPGLSPAVDELVRRVETVSNGNVQIEMAFAVGGFKADAEQQVVRGVADGTYDLGVVGTRVFDALGVKSFQALSAPMLIDSYELEAAVLRSGIPAEMLRSLDPLSVSGLAILGDGLRKPIGVVKPLLSPTDWTGIRFGIYRSKTLSTAVRALGAVPVEVFGPARENALNREDIQGFELNLLSYWRLNLMRLAPHVTLNVNLWPQTFAVIGHPARLASLSGQQRDWLTRAAHETATASVDLVKGDIPLAELCGDGARFANASEAQIAALREAFAQLSVDLEQDPTTSRFIAQIKRLKGAAGAAVTIPAGCTGPVPSLVAEPSIPPTRTTTVTPLDGTWETTYTFEELAATKLVDPSEIEPHNAGTFAIKFDRGVLTDPSRRADAQPMVTYIVEGDTVTLYAPDASMGGEVPPPGPAIWKYRWSIYNDTLTFEKLGGQEPGCSLTISGGMCEPSMYIVKPWHRIR